MVVMTVVTAHADSNMAMPNEFAADRDSRERMRDRGLGE